MQNEAKAKTKAASAGHSKAKQNSNAWNFNMTTLKSTLKVFYTKKILNKLFDKIRSI